MADHFTALLDDLEDAAFRRRLGEFRKARADVDWVEKFWRDHRAAPRAAATLNKLTAELQMMAKAMEVQVAARPTPRQQFDRVHSAFRESVTAGRLTGIQAAMIESRLHHLAAGLR
jgi:hypothetical protein